jgi:O-antigen biosynthesis protein
MNKFFAPSAVVTAALCLIFFSQRLHPAFGHIADEEKEKKLQNNGAVLPKVESARPEKKTKASVVTTKKDRIYVNGKLFFVKGICYSPSYPQRGAGALMFKFLPEDVKKKDFQMMKEAGVNTLRIYESMFDDFYDYANKYGFKVIEPVIYPGLFTNCRDDKALEEYKTQALQRVNLMKDNPAILMWSLWNDMPFNGKPNLVEKFGKSRVDRFFREIYEAIKQIDRNHPVTGANMLNVSHGYDVGFRFLDVIGCNSYAGLDYSPQGWTQIRFSRPHARKAVSRMSSFAWRFDKPVIITEIGCSTYREYDKQGKIVEKQLKAVGEKLAGICLFEWTDEWWKAGNQNVQDNHIEEHWGLLDGYRSAKPAYGVVKKCFSATRTESKGFSEKLFNE